MLGSSASISGANTTLNTAVAEILKQFADELEKTDDFEKTLHELIKKVVTNHKRIIFNGNGYDDKWLKEAEKRGLLNILTTPEALPYFVAKKNVDLFTSHKVYTEKEMYSRLEILQESYCKLIQIEGKTMVEMTLKDILPAVSEYSRALSDTLLSKKAVSKKLPCDYEEEILKKISFLSSQAYSVTKLLQYALDKASAILNPETLSMYYKDEVLSKMQLLRGYADELENLVSSDYWPFPTYGDLLFGI